MRKSILLWVLAPAIALPWGGAAAAEDERPWTLGAGPVWASELERAGGQVGVQYEAQPWLRLAGDVSLFTADRERDPDGTDFRLQAWEWNLNGHLVFARGFDTAAYALVGLNVTTFRGRVRQPGQPTMSGSQRESGLNLGIGGEIRPQWGRLFAEIKHTTLFDPDFDQWVVGAGVRFPLGSR